MNENNPVLNHRKGSDYQKKGNFILAKENFNRNLKLDDINKRKFHFAACFHLAQMEDNLNIKIKLLDKCLELEPNHIEAKIIRKSLTVKMQKRLGSKKGRVLLPFFNKHLLNIQIQTVSTCNGKCVFCPYHNSWHKMNPGKMDKDTFRHILLMLQDIPLGKICLYLENEPLLDQQLWEKIEAIKENLNFKKIEISSNISPLNNSNIKKMMDVLSGTSHEIWLSWHGITPEKYQRLMGFDYEEQLDKLKKYLEITKGSLNTVFNTIIGGRLHKDEQYSSKEDAESFFKKIIKESGINYNEANIRILPMSFHNRAGGFEMSSKFDSKYLQNIGRLKANCYRIDQWLHLLYDGDIILCCMDYNKETVMGNIKEFNLLEDLLSSEKFIDIQKKARGSIKTDENFICKRCIGV